MRALAQEELPTVQEAVARHEHRLKVLLLPKDAADEKNAILEIRAGTGGDEAALFASDLFRMYQRYSELHGWRLALMQTTETGIGGFKEAIAEISGTGVIRPGSNSNRVSTGCSECRRPSRAAASTPPLPR